MRKLPQPINREEFEQLLKEAKDEREKHRRERIGDLDKKGIRINQYIIALCLGFGAGMRISEIVGHKGKAKSGQEINIPALEKDKIESNFIRIINGKGRKDRIVPIPTKIFRLAGITREELLKNLPLKVSRRAIQQYIEELGNKVLKKEISFHKLRHGFVTTALESGIDIHQVQMFAGHSNLATTGIYLHANPKDALEKYQDVF